MTERPVGVTDLAAGAGVAEVRTRERVVGGNTVAEQYVLLERERALTGVYLYSFQSLVQAAAHTANTQGFIWLQNPSGSGLTLALRRSNFASQFAAATVRPTSPRLGWRQATFTGTPSGAQVTPCKAKSSYPANTHTVRSAITGMTITEVADVFSYLPSASLTAVGGVAPAYEDWNPEDEGMLQLAPGEAAVFRQLDAGTASDDRRFVLNFSVEEFTLP